MINVDPSLDHILDHVIYLNEVDILDPDLMRSQDQVVNLEVVHVHIVDLDIQIQGKDEPLPIVRKDQGLLVPALLMMKDIQEATLKKENLDQSHHKILLLKDSGK